MLGVNLGSSLAAGGGLTLHQELIMTMPGTGKLALEKRPASLVDELIARAKDRARDR